MKVGILGAGYWGKNILKDLLKMERCEVRWVCDPNRESLESLKKEFPSINLSTDFTEVLEDKEVDCTIIATPPSLHYSHAKASLERSKHTWVEKPMALTYLEAENLVEISKKKHLQLFVDETFLYDPAISLIKEMIEKGKIGKVYHLLFQRLGMGRIRCDSNVWWNSAPHDLSILRFLFPEPVREVFLHSFSYLQKDVEDVAFASLTLQNGISVFVNLSWFYPISTASLTIIGEKGAIFYEGRFKARKVVIYSHVIGESPKRIVDGVPSPNFIPIEGKIEEEIKEFGEKTPLQNALESFFKAIEDGFEPPSSGANSLSTMKILELAETSKKIGRPVNVV